MNNSFGGSVSPSSGSGGVIGIGRPRYRPLMKNLHVDIPADQINGTGGQMSQRAVIKTDGLISLKKNTATTMTMTTMPNEFDLNNNMHKLNLSGQHFMSPLPKQHHQQQQYQYSPPPNKPSSAIKTSISNFKLSGNDPYHYRNPAIKSGTTPKPPSVDAHDYDDESSCAVCDRKSTTIMCKNCGHDWVVS